MDLLEYGQRELLLQHTKDGRTALHYAAERGCPQLCVRMLEVGGDELVRKVADDGRTCLHYAAEMRYVYVCIHTHTHTHTHTDDGPLRRMEDEANKAFLEDINNGRYERGVQVLARVIDRNINERHRWMDRPTRLSSRISTTAGVAIREAFGMARLECMV